MIQNKKHLSPKERLLKIQTHTKYFLYIKYGILASFFLGVLIFLYAIWFKDLFITKDKNDLFISAPTKREVLEKRIINPQYFSYDKKNKPFIIQALSSHKIDEDHFFLNKPNCNSFKSQKSPVSITSNNGQLEESTKKLYLQGNVNLKKEGVTFKTNSLHFHTKSKEGYGKEPIKGIAPDKEITAGAFEIKDEGNIFHFTQGNQSDRPMLILYNKEKTND